MAMRTVEIIEGQAVARTLTAQEEAAFETSRAVPVAQVKAAAVARIVALIDARAAAITGPTPEFERASWPLKAQAARAYGAGTATAAQAALIDAEAAAAGESGTVAAQRIVDRADAWEPIIGRLTGLRRVAFAAVERAQSEAAVRTALATFEAALA